MISYSIRQDRWEGGNYENQRGGGWGGFNILGWTGFSKEVDLEGKPHARKHLVSVQRLRDSIHLGKEQLLFLFLFLVLKVRGQVSWSLIH